MAKVKKQKILRFKNTPVKKEQSTVTKKKEVSLPSRTTEIIAQQASLSTKEKTIIASSVNPQEKQQSEKQITETIKITELDSITAIPSSDTFLLSSFDKKEKISSYFPKISRVITESPLRLLHQSCYGGRVKLRRSGRWFLIGLFCGMLLVGIILVSRNIQANIQERKDLEQKRVKIQQEITYWQENAQKYPGNRDAYFQLALLEYQLGDAQSSQSYLNKVESIDPNFQEAYTLEKVLVSKR